MFNQISNLDPHKMTNTVSKGPSPSEAEGVAIFLHGRGASAESILGLYDEFEIRNLSALAPQAYDGSWYPFSFMAPIPQNQPFLDSALLRIENLVSRLVEDGIESKKIALLGFSQGACLATEFAVRYPRRYGAIIAFTGGLIGPEGTRWDSANKALSGTPILLASGDPDPHVPFSRILESSQVLRELGGDVDLRRYVGMPHTINQEELSLAKALLLGMIQSKETI